MRDKAGLGDSRRGELEREGERLGGVKSWRGNSLVLELKQ